MADSRSSARPAVSPPPPTRKIDGDGDYDNDTSDPAPVPSPTPIPPVVYAGYYSCPMLEHLWIGEGGDPSAAFVAAEVATAESGGNPNAISPTNDYGLWQINGSHGAEASLDPLVNARAAISISGNGSDWGAWTTYVSGAYIGRCLPISQWEETPCVTCSYSSSSSSDILSCTLVSLITSLSTLCLRADDVPNFDIADWTKGKVSLFEALGLKGAHYPQLKARLVGPASANSVPLSTFAPQAATTPGSSSGGGPVNSRGMKNPIGKGLIGSRIDMGVDYTGRGPLYALGDGTITNVYNKGWPGGTFIGLHLDSGRYVYYAENIAPQVRVNQRVKAGQLVGYARGTYPFVEIGWASPPGVGTTMAAASGESRLGQSQGDPGKYSTGFGVAFNKLLTALGAPGGQQVNPVQGSNPGWS